LNLPVRNLLIACAAAALTAASAFAQGAIIRQGVFEVGGFAGVSFSSGTSSNGAGGTATTISQTRVMGGGNVVYSLTRTFMPFVEVSYFPGIERTQSLTGISGATETYSVPLTDFNGGFHLRIPIPRSHVIPYGVISMGAIHTSSVTTTATIPVPGTTTTTTLTFPVPSTTEAAVSGGVGIRYYTTERLGFRAEFKAYHPVSGANTNTFVRLAFGFFYQF
jgi:hypothetical protein